MTIPIKKTKNIPEKNNYKENEYIKQINKYVAR